MIQSSTPDSTIMMKKPPRPWSADNPDYFYTIGHNTNSTKYDMSITSNCYKEEPTKHELGIRTTSVSAPPLNFKKQWNPLINSDSDRDALRKGSGKSGSDCINIPRVPCCSPSYHN
eukprot:sb/3476645/